MYFCPLKLVKMSNLDYGCWTVSIEKHGRMKLPTSLMRSIPESERKTFWVSHGFGNHIMLWTEKEYTKQISFLNSLDFNVLENKRYRNAFLRNISFIDADTQDRIVIPKPFLDSYQFDKEVVLIYSNGIIEIWDHKQYETEFGMAPTELGELNAKIHLQNNIDTPLN